MSNSIQQRQDALLFEFAPLENWEDRYKKIIEMGRRLPEMPEEYKTESNKVKGCQSQVWLFARLNEKNEMVLWGDSDALLVKGLVAVLLRVYSESKPADILKTPPEFLISLGFEGNLSPSRANGLHSMLKQIQMFATAFQYYLQNKV